MPMSQYACAEAINTRAMQMEDFIVDKEGRKKRAKKERQPPTKVEG